MSAKVENKAKTNENDTEKKCFIITPIGNDTDPIRRQVDGIFDSTIAPVLEEFNYKPLLPHRLSIPGSINKQIVQMIHDSDLVIADLTNKNPNVMYELALRHCFGTPAIMIAEKGTELPFDINNQRTIFYINDAQGVLDLQDNLKKAIIEVTKDNTYESPIISVLGDMKIEKQILQNAKEKSNDSNTDMLKLILDRLNRIENDVRINNNNDIIKYRDDESKSNETIRRVVLLREAGEINLEKVAQELNDIIKEKSLAIRINDITDSRLVILILSRMPARVREATQVLREIAMKYNLYISTISY